MGFWSRLFGRRGERRESATLADPKWMTAMGPRSLSGVSVTTATAMRVATVYACVRVIAETMSTLPLHVYRREGSEKHIDRDHSLYTLLHDQPNALMTSVQMRDQMQSAALLEGNAYARVVRDNLGDVKELIPFHPSRVQVKAAASGRNLIYVIDGGKERYLSGDIWHVTGLTLDGLVGVSPIAYVRETIGIAMAAEHHGASALGNGGYPLGVLKHPGELGPEAAADLRKSWREMHGGGGVGSVAVLEEGMEFQAISMSAKDMQYIETRKFQRSEIAAIFRTPPHMVGDLERATFSNIEQQGLEFRSYTILPWAVRWESSIQRDLFLPSERRRHFASFNLEGLHRADQKARMETYALALTNGIYSPNEVRDLEDRNPREGGDNFMRPLNMTPAGKDASHVTK